MKFIRPTGINDTRFVSSTVPENDHAAWNAATSYSVGARVIRTQTHRIYENLIAGTDATTPETAPARWLDIGPTNRWAMFDEKSATVTTADDSITVVLAPGRVNSLALLGVDARSITVQLVANAETVYSATLDLQDSTQVGDWYEYFYEPIYQQSEVVITDLLDAALLNVPAYGEGVLTVTLERPGGTVSVATMVVGLVADVGTTQFGATVSIRDFSRKETDDFGNTTLVKRDYSKLMQATVAVRAERVDSVVKNISRHRATSVVWIGSSQYGSLIVYGFLTDWRLVIENPVISTFSAEIEGMT